MPALDRVVCGRRCWATSARQAFKTRFALQRLTFETWNRRPGSGSMPAARSPTQMATERQVAVALGPEYGTVGCRSGSRGRQGSRQGRRLRSAAGLRLRIRRHKPRDGKGVPPEVDGGWAVTTEERKFGKLPVLLVRMNPDLSMGEELLKQTGAGNLFTVFGEPDVQIDRTDDGSRGRGPRRRRLRPDHGRDPLRRRTPSLAGSSTRTTTARASSSATPISPVPTTPTSAYVRHSRPRSTRTPGRRCTERAAVHSTRRTPEPSR